MHEQTKINVKLNDLLALMAVNPEIQRELKLIEDEFSCTEADGLENI